MNKSWSDRIAELEAAGLSLRAIALEMGISPSALSDIKAMRSKEPRGIAAVHLYKLHERFVERPAKRRGA